MAEVSGTRGHLFGRYSMLLSGQPGPQQDVTAKEANWAVPLAGVSAPQLRFWWMNLGNDSDDSGVYISDDGQQWAQVWTPAYGDWDYRLYREEIDLATAAASPSVNVRGWVRANRGRARGRR